MGGGTTSNTQTTTQNLTPEQQGLVSLAYPQYQQFAASNPTMPTGSQAVAPFTEAQTAGQNAVIGATGVGGAQPATGSPTGPGGQWSGGGGQYGGGGTTGSWGTPAPPTGGGATGSWGGGGAPGAPGPGTTGAAPNMTGTVGTAAGTNQYLSSGAFLDPGSNPYVQNAVNAATQPIYENLTRSVLPQIQSGATTGAGGVSANYGGSRQGIAEGLASEGAARAAGATGANIENTALGQGLTATNQAIAQAPTTATSLALPGATTEAVGGEQQTQQQNVLNANNAAAWFQQMLPLLKAQSLTSGAAGLPGGSTTAVGQGTTDPGLFADILGGASAAGGLLGGIGKLGGSGGLGALLPLLAL